MTPPHAKRPALICVAQGLQGPIGHTAPYVETVCEAAKEFFDNVMTLAPCDYREERAGLLPVLPTADSQVHRIFRSLSRPVQSGPPKENSRLRKPSRKLSALSLVRPAIISALARFMADNLAKNLEKYAVPGSHVFFEHCNPLIIHSLARLSVHQQPGHITAWHCLFRMPPEIAARGFRSVEALFGALNGLVDLYGDEIYFYTDTRHLTLAYQKSLKYPEKVRTLPLMPLIQFSGHPQMAGSRGDELRIGYMGEARLEKGYGDLPWLYEHLPGIISGRRVRLVIQTDSSARHRTSTTAVTQWLQTRPSVLERPELEFLAEMSPQQYALSYADLDISLLLYSDWRYRYSSSGIMAEAVGFGIPVLCYNQTFMADLLTEATGRGQEVGLAVSGLKEIPMAVAVMADKISSLKADMRSFGDRWLPAQSPRNLLLQLLNNSEDEHDRCKYCTG